MQDPGYDGQAAAADRINCRFALYDSAVPANCEHVLHDITGTACEGTFPKCWLYDHVPTPKQGTNANNHYSW